MYTNIIGSTVSHPLGLPQNMAPVNSTGLLCQFVFHAKFGSSLSRPVSPKHALQLKARAWLRS